MQLLWRGKDALISAMKLISAAEMAVGGNRNNKRPFVWRQSILRPAKKAKQVRF